MVLKSPHRSSWFILLIVLLASVAGPLNQFKAPPVLRLLMDAFSVPTSGAGLFMSVFSFAGLILAIPGGFIFQRLGYRSTGLIAILAIVIGAAMGAVSLNAGTMLTSRFIEGIGNSFMGMVAPAVIALWFTAERRGKAMGIWSAWVPLGSIIMFAAAPFLAGQWNWQGVWWFGCLYAVCVGLLFYAFISPPPQQPAAGERVIPLHTHTRGGLRGVLRNRDLWLISVLWGCFSFSFTSFLTWAPTFLRDVHGFSFTRASFLMSAMAMLGIVGCPIAGWISDRLGSRKVVCVIPMMAMLILWPLASVAGGTLFSFLAMLIAFLGGFPPTGVFSATSEVVRDEKLRGMAMGVIQIGQNVGLLLGPLVFGSIIQFFGGWQMAFWALVPVTALGIVAGMMAKMEMA
jgi:MFS family permease